MGGLDAAALLQELRDVFGSGKTRNAQWRKDQLNGIARLAKERAQEIVEALDKDLRKPPFEAAGELALVQESATQAAAKIDEWMSPQKVVSAVPIFANSAVIPEPLGVVLNIVPWNYPFILCLDPIVGAIAAGNVAVIKPSELAPATSALVAKLVPLYLDSSAIRVVEGGIEEATALLEQRWDKCFCTGSQRIGKIVMAAAAKHLTPVTLELGGKSPTIVDSTANLDVVAKRISSGKWTANNGQTCVSPDYVLAVESIAPELVKHIKDTLKEFFGEQPQNSPDLSRLINRSHFTRLNGLLSDETTADKVVHGGKHDEKSLYIEPTLILNPPLHSPIMQEEIFGPLLVVITVKDVDEAISIVNSRPKPLALYLFSTDQNVVDRVVSETSSGGVTVNDTMLHSRHRGLPFGGVGESGMGKYHGDYSFAEFSHKKAVLYQSLAVDMPGRYPPR